MSKYQLFAEIIARSRSSNWDDAKLEWKLAEIYFVEESETCLCGHYPIKELCVLKNKHNHKETTVGNCCVKKFLGLPSDKIFDAVKRIRKDEGKSLNKEALTHALENGWINDWEFGFYLDTCRKRKLTDKQISKRIQINNKVLFKMNGKKS